MHNERPAYGNLVTRTDTLSDRGCRSFRYRGLSRGIDHIIACITGVVTLVEVILSNSKSRTVMEVKIDALTAKMEKHNRLVERTYALEQDMTVAKNDIESLKQEKKR